VQLGDRQPVVRTVDIQNLNGLNGVVGDPRKAEAAVNNNGSYSITGTAVVTDAAHPAASKDLPFRIDVTC
jgi:hypothetical protein